MRTRFFYIFLLVLIVLPQFGLAQILTDKNGNPLCEPSQNNLSASNACNLAAFTRLVQNIIRYMTLLIFPIAAVAIGWGGFMILTSGGSSERMASGKKAIKIAIIGIIILLVSYLLITFIYNTLGVTTDNTTDFPAAN